MNSLLTTADFDEEVSRFEVGKVKLQQVLKGETGNSSSVHPIRAVEDENLDYDSNASSSSFEFHQGEQRSNQNHIARSLLRPMSSKWNDAEKWIMNKQNAKANNYSKKNALQSQTDRVPGKIVPELSVKRVDFCEPSDQLGFDFDHPPQSKVMIEVENKDISSAVEDSTGGLGIRAVEMRDMGTEMTPIPSQEPSRTSTPLCATTPLRSPTSSIPTTPRRGGAGHDDVEPRNENENGNMELSDQDLKLKTRREIVALGVQLGKKNITAWASRDDKTEPDADELRMVEFDKRAAAWEEAEKSRHTARFKREEIKIQAWESRQKAELEAETRQIEAQMEEMRARSHAKMVKKIAMARQRSEEKRAAAEARKTREAERTAARAEYIRQTGKIPSSSYICCAWT
jgi:hypothetical protein